MREIKFRAWYKITKEMEYLKDTSWPYWGDCILENSDADGTDTGNYKIMQFTGLKDRNGKEIYEGDILSPGYTDDELFVVVFDETKARFAEKRVSKNYPTHAGFIMDGSFLRTVLSSQRIEIIGNIYENPELLKT